MSYTEKYNGEYSHTTQLDMGAVSKHPLHTTWRMMNVRCYDTRHKAYHRYGARGVLVNSNWRWDNPKGFFNFVTDVGERPEGTTLDRIDNDKEYSKENCKWSTKKEQQNNIGLGLRNKSGDMGVSFDPYHNAWIAQIGMLGSTKNLGIFNVDDKELAIKRYETIKKIKIEQGDQVAYDYYLSIKDLTPAGKQKRRNKTSRYYGVAKGRKGKWRAFTNEYVDGKLKQISLGQHENELDAYQAVLKRLEETKEIV